MEEIGIFRADTQSALLHRPALFARDAPLAYYFAGIPLAAAASSFARARPQHCRFIALGDDKQKAHN